MQDTFSMSVDHVMVRSSIGWSLSAGTMTIWKDGMAGSRELSLECERAAVTLRHASSCQARGRESGRQER